MNQTEALTSVETINRQVKNFLAECKEANEKGFMQKKKGDITKREDEDGTIKEYEQKQNALVVFSRSYKKGTRIPGEVEMSDDLVASILDLYEREDENEISPAYELGVFPTITANKVLYRLHTVSVKEDHSSFIYLQEDDEDVEFL